MAPKQQLEKNAWQWAETTSPDQVTLDNIRFAYRTNLAPCKLGACRRNCKGNPLCLNGLGEREWFADITDNQWHDIEDPESERRKELWFHNLEFRSALLQWQDVDKPLKEASHEEGGQTSLQPKSICGHLQLIFGLLLFSKRRFIDPSGFIEFLSLDTAQQQDAQEFSKLFTSLLEDTLSQHPNPKLQNFIREQFVGKYAYVTSCAVCGTGSDTPSNFYELDLNIKGHRDLGECIEEFLEEEKLEGDNKYMCAQCQLKQNAARKIELRSLPPVLNLQLLRFVFDRNTGQKKKLNTYIQFPEVLDMGQYFLRQGGNLVYELSAVLIHRGPSAYSGHYVAHIKDRPTQTWHKFNDEDTEKMSGKNLQLGNEEDIEGTKGSKKPKSMKGSHASRNAYMLVYTRQQSESQQESAQKTSDIKFTDLPPELQEAVEKDNQQFEDWVKDMSSMIEESIKKGKERQEEIQGLYSQMSYEKGEPYDWISLEWFTSWLTGEASKPPPPVDNTKILCEHNNLDPDRAWKARCISQGAADMIYANYGGGPRLRGEDVFCEKCVVSQCRVIHTSARIAEDSKMIMSLLKSKDYPTNAEDCYWVGKSSLRSWRRLAAEECTNQAKDDEPPSSRQMSEGGTNETGPNSGPVSVTGSNGLGEGGGATACDSVDCEEQDHLQFNEDVLCDMHGKLDVDTSCRRLVPKDIWLRLKAHFPNAPEFSFNATPCQECQDIIGQANIALDQQKCMAAEQKAALRDLYLDRNRPTWKDNIQQLNVLSAEFVEAWKQFIRDKGTSEPITETANNSLLCPHGGFPFHPQSVSPLTPNKRFVYIWHSEWAQLEKLVKCDVEIMVMRISTEGSPDVYVCSPAMCEGCCKQRETEKMEAQLNYTKATVFVQKIAGTQEAAKSELQDNGHVDSSKGDPDFAQHSSSQFEEEPPPKVAKLDLRRSSRRRLSRGIKEIEINSTMSLRDLKKKVFLAFKIMVSDQHLIMDGRELRGEGESLASLHVLPDTVLCLQADEPNGDIDTAYLDDVRACQPEEGFKGTSLLGR